MMNSNQDRSIWEMSSQFITDYDWLLLLFLLPLVIFPNHFTIALLLIIPMLWIVRKVTTGRFAISTPADWAILLLLIMLLVSLFATFDLAFSAPRVAGTLLWVLPVYITLTVAGLWETRLMRRGPAKVRWAVLFVGVAWVQREFYARRRITRRAWQSLRYLGVGTVLYAVLPLNLGYRRKIVVDGTFQRGAAYIPPEKSLA